MNFVTRGFGAITGRVQDQLKQSQAWALPSNETCADAPPCFTATLGSRPKEIKVKVHANNQLKLRLKTS